MTEDLKQQLIALADKYEVPSFTAADPSQFTRWYKIPGIEGHAESKGTKGTETDVECACFIAAMLAFGNRKQFIPKIQQILTLADQKKGSISQWLLNGVPDFPAGEAKFYRFYSYNDMRTFFSELGDILRKKKSLGEWFKEIYLEQKGQSKLHQIIASSFPKSKIVPKGTESANKRTHMLLRWLVRQNSPVDLGIWDWYPASELLLPLDVHVMEEGIKLRLLPEKVTASNKSALKLTDQFKEIWPEDPTRGDFALFGLGVDEEAKNS